jgi:hypothetical protein
MDRKVLEKVFSELDAMSPGELRSEILSGEGGAFETILTAGGFIAARSEENVQASFGTGVATSWSSGLGLYESKLMSSSGFFVSIQEMPNATLIAPSFSIIPANAVANMENLMMKPVDNSLMDNSVSISANNFFHALAA